MPLSGKELKVVVVAPVGRDARLLRDALSAGGLNAQAEPSLTDALPHLQEVTIGALLFTEEVLDQGNIALLGEVLGDQPEWSDLPILILTVGGSATKLSRRREQDRLPLGSITLLEGLFVRQHFSAVCGRLCVRGEDSFKSATHFLSVIGRLWTALMLKLNLVNAKSSFAL